MGGKSSPPPPPDYTPIANASKEAAEISAGVAREQLAWAKDQYASDKAITDRVVNQFLRTQDVNAATAAADRARYERVYQPLEDRLAAEAIDYASPERQRIEEGRAQAAVAQQFEQARDSSMRQLESFGVDPTSTRAAALDIGLRAQQGAAQAAAGNQARMATEATGRALRSEAINVGRGYPGQIAGQYGTAIQAGAGGVNAALAQTASGANTMGTGAQYMGLQNQSLGTWSGALNAGYQNQMSAYNAANPDQSGMWGTALGLAGSAAIKFLADGGPTDGGGVPNDASPSDGAAIDDVPARLTAGEFVVPKDVAAWKGEEYFQKLIDQSRKAKGEASAKPAVGYAPAEEPTFVSRPSGALPLR
jgi:hypothetical protein